MVLRCEQFSFEQADLDYLQTLGFDEDTLNAFGDLHFTGDVWAVPEGRMVFANEPILEVTVPHRRGPTGRDLPSQPGHLPNHPAHQGPTGRAS